MELGKEKQKKMQLVLIYGYIYTNLHTLMFLKWSVIYYSFAKA